MFCGKSIVLFTLFAMSLVDQPAPEVKIAQGILSGKISADGSFFEYVGIPYATSNSSARFKAPLPPPSWKGVFKAVDESYQCPQPTVVGVLGTEDCLKINIYVPAKAKSLPVMVFIHGGTFVIGNGAKSLYGPEFLMKQDVILITFNYRLGALGFLCLGIKEAPGNAGLKDQIAALRWVKKNIAAFGGDPDNVTIFGLSAGAVSVSILLASPAAEGLFNRAIIQSGVSTASWAINRQPLFTARLIAKELGYNTTDPQEIYEILSRIPYKDFIAATPVKPIGKYFDFQLLNYPCVERVIEGEETILTDLPYNLLTKYSKNVSVMLGTASKEGLMLLAYDTEESLKERDSKYVFAPDVEFTSEEEAETYSKIVKQIYFGEEHISFKTHDTINELYTHMYFEVPNLLETELIINNTEAAVYNYYFNYSGGRNFLKFINGYRNEAGACHGDELMYIFKGLAWPFPVNKRDQIMVKRMTTMFANFARHGDPTPTPGDLPVRWEPSTKNEIKLLYIDDELKMGPIPNPKPYRLWKDIYTKYRKRDKTPQPPPSWDGVFRATEEIYQCPQNSPIGVVGMEDCLKINVYVPAMAHRPLPVMFYVHGGAFILGSGGKMIYAPDFIIQRDVILVTFNYRLGALGFLCLGIEGAPGNAGLKDQVAALRWVQKNIAAFGGDPENVTIFGHSAGGTSVALLVASDITEGLFKRAIIQSGSSLANWAVNRDPVLVASTIAKLLGHNTKDPKKLYELFSRLSYKDLISATADLPIGRQVKTNVLHLPCVERKNLREEPFLTDLPYNLLTKKPKNITLMYGSMDKEGLFFVSEETDETLEFNNNHNLFADDLVFQSKEEEIKVAKELKQYYFGYDNVNRKTLMNLSELYTDLYFEMPMLLEAELMAKNIDAPIYIYYFTYSGGRNMVKHRSGFINEPGACHGDDILYMFKGKLWPYKISKADQNMIDWMTKMITNFAKFGEPTPGQMNDLPVRWLPNNKNKLKVLHIGDVLKMGSIPKPEAFQFWKNIYNKYRRL